MDLIYILSLFQDYLMQLGAGSRWNGENPVGAFR
jgi:hypothetical protein